MSSGDGPNTNGRMLLVCNSLAIFSLRDVTCSADSVSARRISGITLVRWDNRRRYSISTGLAPMLRQGW